jgi:ADP-heptose:LPS heptosyltransferase
MKSFVKFFLKTYLVQGFVKVLLFLTKDNNKKEYSNRILIIDTQAIGDLVVATSTLKHYQNAFSDKKIDILIRENTGMKKLLLPYCDQVITVNYDAYKRNPLYTYGFIKKIQTIKYEMVIVHDHAIVEIEAKELALYSKAKQTIMYEGFLLQETKPINRYMELHCQYVRKNILPKFTKTISSFDRISNKEIANVIEHYQYFYEQITQRKENEYETLLKIPEDDQMWRREQFKKRGIEKKKYAVFTVGSSSKWKNWPVQRFEEIAQYCQKKEIVIVVTGSGADQEIVKKLKIASKNIVWDSTGQTTIAQSAAIIQDALFLVSNDTSSVHIAVALKTPCVCVVGTGQLGNISLYGHPDIHKWIYKKGDCYLDNWRCTSGLSDNEIAPCINAVSTEMVIDQLEKLLQYLKTQDHIPNTHFRTSYTQ